MSLTLRVFQLKIESMLIARHISRYLFALIAIASVFTEARSQEIVDKTIATINDGVRTELITYSDLRWQLALQPNAPLDTPRSEDLNRVLQTLIDQRLFALEAERLPRLAPTEEEIAREINKTLSYFPSTAVFETRLKQVGFESVRDDNFERIIAQRVAINNYIDFRFRSFAVVTPDEQTRYYRNVFEPDFRKRFPGVVVPTLEEKREDIRQTLTEDRVATRIESFLDQAKRRVEIYILIEV